MSDSTPHANPGEPGRDRGNGNGEVKNAAGPDGAPPQQPDASLQQQIARTSLSGRKLRFAKKHEKRQAHAHEHNKDADWFLHKKHVLVLTWSARPVYTRYGDETAMAAYMGVTSAIISNFERHDDSLQSITAGGVTFVFVVKGPIYLVAISRTGESVAQLQRQLHYVHLQIISVLTDSVNATLHSRPQFDIRSLLGGTEYLLSDLIAETNSNPAFMMDSTRHLRMPKAARGKIAQILRKSRPRNLFFVLLSAGSDVVALVQTKERPLATTDTLLLINFVTNMESLRQGEAWTPVCLPGVSDKGFLYAYVCFFSEDVCLTLLSGDAEGFDSMRQLRLQIEDALTKGNCLTDIDIALAAREPRLEEMSVAVPELRHFLFANCQPAQFVQTELLPPFTTKKAARALFRRYQRLHARLVGGPHRLPIYYEVCGTVTVAGWQIPDDFEMYCVFSPLVSKEAVTTACNRILRWVKSQEDSLFSLSPFYF